MQDDFIGITIVDIIEGPEQVRPDLQKKGQRRYWNFWK